MTIASPSARRPDPATASPGRHRRHASVLVAVLAVHALGLWALLAGLSDPPELPVPGEVVTTALLLPEPASAAAAAAAAAPARPAAAKPQPARPQAKPAQQPPTAQPLPAPSVPARSQPPAALPPAAQAPSSQAPAGASAPAAPAAQANAASASAAAGSAVASPAPARIELPSSSADSLNNPKPAYPGLSKRLGEEGKVVLRVLIEADGSASKAEIRSSSGYDRLDQAALQTVLRWRYLPGKRNGVAEAMWFNVPINFVLE